MAIHMPTKKTLIIPVTKSEDKYIVEVSSFLWNHLQALILLGADKLDYIIEFKIEKKQE